MGEASGVEGFGGCGFLSSSCLINSACLGLSGLNLTEGGGGGGALVGFRGLPSGASPVGPWGPCARCWRWWRIILKQSN